MAENDPQGGMEVPFQEPPPSPLRLAIAEMKRLYAAGDMEGATKFATIVSKLQQQQQQSAAPTTRDYVQTFGTGINRGLAAGAGAPVDLMNAALGVVGAGTERPFGGSQWIRENTFGRMEEALPGVREAAPEWMQPYINTRMITPDATDRTGQVLGRIGEEIGATAALGPMVMGRANQVMNAAAPIRPAARSVAETVYAPIAQNPGKAAAADLALGTTAGVGAAGAQQVFPDNPIAEVAGQLIGGFGLGAGTLAAGGLTRKGAQALRDVVAPDLRFGLTKEGREAASTAAAERTIRKVLGPHLQGTDAAIDEALRLRERAPGFKPTVGEATGRTSLINEQTSREGRASGTKLEGFVNRRRKSEQAITDFANRQAPPGEGTPEFVVDTAARNLEGERAAQSQLEEALQGEREALATGVPKADQSEVGAALRERLLTERKAAQEHFKKRSRELGLDETDLSEPFEEFRQGLIDELEPKSRFEDASNYPEIFHELKQAKQADEPLSELDQLIEDTFGPQVRGDTPEVETEPLTFSDIKALRERISDDLIDSSGGSNPNTKKVRTLTLMKERLDQFVESLDGEFGSAAENWREFRKEYFNDYINRFDAGVAFKVRQKDGRGFYQTRDERVASSFFEPGNTSAAKQFKKVYGDSPEAKALIQSAAMDSLRQDVIRDGAVDPKLLQTWMRKHESVLAEFPEIRQQVGNVFEAQKNIGARQEQLVQRGREIEDRALVRSLNSYAKDTKNAAGVIADAVGSPKKMDQLVAALKDQPDALAALRRNIWDDIASGGAARIRDTLQKNAESLKKLFGDEHFTDLNDIAAMREMIERTPSPTGQAEVPQILGNVEEALGIKIPQALSRGFALHTGRTSPSYIYGEAGLRWLRQRAAKSWDRVMEQAIYDPEVARALADSMRRGKELPPRLHGRLFALGVPLLRENEGEAPGGPEEAPGASGASQASARRLPEAEAAAGALRRPEGPPRGGLEALF